MVWCTSTQYSGGWCNRTGGNFDSHFSVTFFGSLSPILYVKFHLNFDQENYKKLGGKKFLILLAAPSIGGSNSTDEW